MELKKEACGLIAVVGHAQAAQLTATALCALQHRGEEAAGIAASDGKRLQLKTGLGYVSKVFENTDFSRFKNHHFAVGHTRYSVTGSTALCNTQPMLVQHVKGNFALAHNGNLTNSLTLKRKLEKQGAIFQTSMDSEIFVHLIAQAKSSSLKASIIEAIKKVRGAFSVVVLTKDKVYAFRDANGFRPLVLGLLPNGAKMVASETCALDLLSARYMGQVHAGELVTVTTSGLKREKVFANKAAESKCVFEMIYFSRPDSLVFGESVYTFRRRVGELLAMESPVDADLVVPIPDSGNPSALGYSEAAGIPLEFAITKNHYVGRSFIQPTSEMRSIFVKTKLNPIKNLIHKKRVVLVDDSIVRGTTTKQKISALREAGVREIHMRVAAPPVKYPCFYGVDLPDFDELLANQHDTLVEISRALGLDSLAYISLPGLIKASNQTGFCTACFSGKYPVKVQLSQNKRSLEKSYS